MYISFIRPLLEYSDSVWDNCSNETKKTTRRYSYSSRQNNNGRYQTLQYRKFFAELGWESLQERRSKHKRIIFDKILNGLTPRYLTDLIPPLVQETALYSLRNSDDIQTFHANTNLFYNSFFSFCNKGLE